MKKGRPSKRYEVYNLIFDFFSKNAYPANVKRITDYINSVSNLNLSWNTVKKYLEELVKLDKLKKIKLEHSKEKGKEGLTLYAPKD